MNSSLSESSGRANGARALSLWRPNRSAMLALLAVAVLLAGCRTPEAQTLLEHENFQQEKTIEDLRDQIDEVQQDLQDCRRANAALKHQLGGAKSGESSGESPSLLTPPSVAPPTSPPPSTSPSFHPPTIDRGTAAPLESAPGDSRSEQWVPPKLQTGADPGDVPLDSRATTSAYQEDEPRAVRISMIRLLTAGHQFGGHVPASYRVGGELGDNGVQVAFTPRDAQNRAVAAEGSVAMVVIDPAISGADARVARWDFSAAAAKSHYRKTLFGKAYRFDLLWPQGPPRHERLKLFVRLTTPDGQRLETDQTIFVRLVPATPPDDSNVADSDFANSSVADSDADSPAPHDDPPPSERVAARSATGSAEVATDSPQADAPADAMGEFDPDDPAPPDGAPPRAEQPSPVRSGAAWRPDR